MREGQYKYIKKRIYKNKELYNYFKTKRNNKKRIIITISIIFSIIIIALFLYYLTLPKIILKDSNTIKIEYNEPYIEKGAKAKYLNKNVDKDIKITNNIDTSKIGKYKVVYKIREGLITVTKVKTVIIVDKKPPVITLKGENDINVCPDKEYEEEGYTAYDEYDKDLTKEVIKTIKNDEITYTVKDKSGNSTSITRKISKEDKKNPELTLNGNNEIYVEVGSKYEEPGYKSYDNCDQDITAYVEVNSNIDINKVGNYTITYTSIDKANNKTTSSRKIIVYKKDTYVNDSANQNGVIYLTFDDGPNNLTTNRILDVLKKEGIYATFFVTNSGSDSVLKREFEENHSIGLHTATHKWEIYTSTSTYFNDLSIISARVKRVTGLDSKIIRFPGGSSNTISKKYNVGIMSVLSQEVIRRGYRYFDWNVSGSDAGGCTNSKCVYNSVIKDLSKNKMNMVLLHDTKSYTADAIESIIDYGKANGYKFSKITDTTPMYRMKVFN